MPKPLISSGEPQDLMTAGEADGGTMQYALGDETFDVLKYEWSTEIPTGTDVGDYLVWYKVVGDNNHEDSDLFYVGVATIIEDRSDNVLAIDEEKGIATVKDDVSWNVEVVSLNTIKEGSIYRAYNPNSGEHFYTKNPDEAEGLINLGW